MSSDTADAVLAAMDRTTAHTVDLTGGAPELNLDLYESASFAEPRIGAIPIGIVERAQESDEAGEAQAC